MKEEVKLRLPMDDVYNEESASQYIKSYMFLKGYSIGKDLPS